MNQGDKLELKAEAPCTGAYDPEPLGAPVRKANAFLSCDVKLPKLTLMELDI